MGDLSNGESTSKMGRLRALLSLKRTPKRKESVQDSQHSQIGPAPPATVPSKSLPQTPIHSNFTHQPTQNTTDPARHSIQNTAPVTTTTTTTTVTPPHMSSKRDSLSLLATSPGSTFQRRHDALDHHRSVSASSSDSAAYKKYPIRPLSFEESVTEPELLRDLARMSIVDSPGSDQIPGDRDSGWPLPLSSAKNHTSSLRASDDRSLSYQRELGPTPTKGMDDQPDHVNGKPMTDGKEPSLTRQSSPTEPMTNGKEPSLTRESSATDASSTSSVYEDTTSNPQPAHGEPLSADEIVNRSKFDSEDVDVSTKTAPAVTHETVKNEVTHIRQEQITREIHDYDVYHLIQPVLDIEVLPTKHYLQTTSGLVEIPKDELPCYCRGQHDLSQFEAEVAASGTQS